MAHQTVKLSVNEDGEPDTRGRHLVSDFGGSPTLFCTGEVFGHGEGYAEGAVRDVKRGGITCADCLDRIREIKAIRL